MNFSQTFATIAFVFFALTMEVDAQENQNQLENFPKDLLLSLGQTQPTETKISSGSPASGKTGISSTPNIFNQIEERQNLKPDDGILQLPADTATQPLPAREDTAALKTPGQSNSIGLVIQNQLNDLRDLDLSKAYYAYMSLDFQKAYSVDVFKAFVRKNPTLFRNKLFTAENTTFHDIVAEVTGRLVSTDGQVAKVQYDLIQEDGNWKIRKIDLIQIFQPSPSIKKPLKLRP